MDKNSLLLATGLAFSPVPATANDAPKTQVTILQQKLCTVLSAENCKADGLRADISIPSGSGHITIGLEKSHETAGVKRNYSQQMSESFTSPYLTLNGSGSVSASTESQYNIKSERVTVEKSFHIGTLGRTGFDAIFGGDIGRMQGSTAITGAAQASVTLQGKMDMPATKVTIPASLQGVAEQYGIKEITIPGYTRQENLTRSADFNDFYAKDGKTLYGGLSAGVTANMPLTNNIQASAHLGGRFGAEKATTTACLGAIFTSRANPDAMRNADGLCAPLKPASGSGYFLSAAFQSTTVHRDTLFDKALPLAERTAERGNAKIEQMEAQVVNQAKQYGLPYTSTVPKITGHQVLDAIGFVNPYMHPQNHIVVQAGKTWNDTTLFIMHSAPVGATKHTHQPATQIGLSHNF